MTESIINGRRLITTVKHAVGTFGIAAVSVILPHRLVQQGLETRGIAFLRQQIAGPLPAEDISRWVPPGGARVGLVSRQKVEEECRLIKSPFSTLAELENLTEKVDAPRPHQEDVLLRRLCVPISR